MMEELVKPMQSCKLSQAGILQEATRRVKAVCLIVQSKRLSFEPALQARAEDYSETLAFVRLLNSLLKAAGTHIPEQGRPYAHFEEFVRLELLGQVSQRGYRCPFPHKQPS